MRDTARAERLLSLFTSPDCAAAIAGDLTEERPVRGSIWFWVHVVGAVAALWRSSVVDAPVAVLSLAATGCVLFAAPAFCGFAVVGVFPQLIGSLVTWVPFSLVWWGGAVWTGASLVGLAPQRGMAACATLAVFGEALLIVFGVRAAWDGSLSALVLPFYITALSVSAPLLAGGALARRRMSACTTTTVEPRG